MPNNRLKEFIERLMSLENKVDIHLNDGITVKTDIAELKESQKFLVKAFWVMTTAFATAAGSLAVAVIKKLLEK